MPARTLVAAPAFALPVLFLGYAVVANYEFASGLGRDIAEMPKSASAYLNGEAAIQIDDYYKKIMPHRLPSIDVMGAARYLLFSEGRRGVVVGSDGWLFSREEFEAPLGRTADLEEAETGIDAVRDELAAYNVKLVVVPVPAKADIYSEYAGASVISADLVQLYEEFRQLLNRQGIANVDTRPGLMDAKAVGKLFLATDTHWTPLGASVVADSVGQSLGASGNGEYTLAEAAPTEREGDLSKFIVTGGLAPLVGLGPEMVTPLEAASPSASADVDIFGPSSIPYVLVGTSYSANDLWSFGDSLKAALGADVLNVAEEGQGPIVPMRAFLASDALKNSPPETVIWEFPVRYLGQPGLWTAQPKGTAS